MVSCLQHLDTCQIPRPAGPQQPGLAAGVHIPGEKQPQPPVGDPHRQGMPVLIRVSLLRGITRVQTGELKVSQADPLPRLHVEDLRPADSCRPDEPGIVFLPSGHPRKHKVSDPHAAALHQFQKPAHMVRIPMADDGVIHRLHRPALQIRLKTALPQPAPAAASPVHQHRSLRAGEHQPVPLPHVQTGHGEPGLGPRQQYAETPYIQQENGDKSAPAKARRFSRQASRQPPRQASRWLPQ